MSVLKLSSHPSNACLSAHIDFLGAGLTEVETNIHTTSEIECYAPSYREALARKFKEIQFIKRCARKDEIFSLNLALLNVKLIRVVQLLEDRVAHSLDQRINTLTRQLDDSSDRDVIASLHKIKKIFREFKEKIHSEMRFVSHENQKILARVSRKITMQMQFLKTRIFIALLHDKSELLYFLLKNQGNHLLPPLHFLKNYECVLQHRASTFIPSRKFGVAIAIFQKAIIEDVSHHVRNRGDTGSQIKEILFDVAHAIDNLEKDACKFHLKISVFITAVRISLDNTRKNIEEIRKRVCLADRL